MSESTPATGSTPVPIFLFSLPRSGSTLLQRIIATHPDVATGPEPTFLLPLLHIVSDSAVLATFDQRFTAMAVDDFFGSTGDREIAFDEMVRAAAGSAYGRATPSGVRYFLDKTPKYHMVADHILRIFPESPAIVLWRHPLAVIASLMSTWGGSGGRWNLHHFRLDLFHALPALIDVVQAHPHQVHSIRYEDLVGSDVAPLTALFEHLKLDISKAAIERFSDVELVGRVQDPNVGTDGFTSVRSDRVAQWTTILSNPLRKAWSRRYLRWLGHDRLAAMGYDLDTTLAELDAVEPSPRFLASDLVLVPYDTIYRVFEIGVFKKKVRDLKDGRRPLLAHK